MKSERRPMGRVEPDDEKKVRSGWEVVNEPEVALTGIIGDVARVPSCDGVKPIIPGS